MISESIKLLLAIQGSTVLEMQDVTTNPDIFCNALARARNSQRFGELVNARTPSDLSNARLYLSKNGFAGCAVESNGNITAVFKHQMTVGDWIPDIILLTALSFGGDRLDCYAGDMLGGDTYEKRISYLPILYRRYGFVPVARVPFNADFAIDGFVERFGVRDILVFAHNGDSPELVAKTIGRYKQFSLDEYLNLPEMEYSEALVYRDSLIRNHEVLDTRR